MLSNDTKLKRINEKLFQYGLKLEFGCFDLKTYTPILYKIQEEPVLYGTYRVYGIQLGAKVVGNNKVKLYVVNVTGIDGNKQSGDWFKLYVEWIENINGVINYCNNLSLVVPEYLNF